MRLSARASRRGSTPRRRTSMDHRPCEPGRSSNEEGKSAAASALYLVRGISRRSPSASLMTTSVPLSLACNCSLALSNSIPVHGAVRGEVDVEGVTDADRFHLSDQLRRRLRGVVNPTGKRREVRVECADDDPCVRRAFEVKTPSSTHFVRVDQRFDLGGMQLRVRPGVDQVLGPLHTRAVEAACCGSC